MFMPKVANIFNCRFYSLHKKMKNNKSHKYIKESKKIQFLNYQDTRTDPGERL